MNRTEHLLTCLAEECAEVQQAVAKALRFGLDDGYPGTDRTNAADIAQELKDVVAVAEMLEECGALPNTHTMRDIEAKKAKVAHYMEYAEQRGTLVSNARMTGAGLAARRYDGCVGGSMELVTLPEMEKGAWKIERFTVDRTDFHSALRGRGVPVGETFTKVTRNGYLVMSDTPAEQSDHWEAVRRAKGSCLLNGLGIGMVLKNILLKPSVTDITVVEIAQDLIDIVAPHYADPRVTFVCADALKYQPPKGKRYQMVWHDIWDNICGDNLKDMEKLHRKYGRRTDWQNSWCKYECQRGR